MTILYKLDEHGGFTAGDTVTGATDYAYPTSFYATLAKRDPRRAAGHMLKQANWFAPHCPAHIADQTNERNWRALRQEG